MNKIRKIEINFPVEIEIPDGWDQVLDSLVDMICQQYEDANPTRSMWPAGHGSKILWDTSHEMALDNSIYVIDVAEREASERELTRRKKRNE